MRYNKGKMTKILLVEDDRSLREIYGVRLLAEGYDIVSAGDGEEALAMAIKERPDLIVSDVMMPKISGFDMLDILRSTTETRDIRVIMMTALSSADQRARGEQLGADRYLVKSQVGIEDVVRAVHEVLGDNGASAPASPAETPAAPQPAAPSAPEAPAPAETPAATPAPVETSMPQPTAPFTSPRPATLGERVIQPIEAPAQAADSQELSLAERIAAELGTTTAAQATPQPAAPSAPEASAPAETPAPIETPAETLPPQQ